MRNDELYCLLLADLDDVVQKIARQDNVQWAKSDTAAKKEYHALKLALLQAYHNKPTN